MPVYILRSGDSDMLKIGRTRGEVRERIKQLCTGNPHPLSIFREIDTNTTLNARNIFTIDLNLNNASGMRRSSIS